MPIKHLVNESTTSNSMAKFDQQVFILTMVIMILFNELNE